VKQRHGLAVATYIQKPATIATEACRRASLSAGGVVVWLMCDGRYGVLGVGYTKLVEAPTVPSYSNWSLWAPEALTPSTPCDAPALWRR
jgi:hypothetical protein